MRVVNLYAATGFVIRAINTVGGQGLGLTPRPTPNRLLVPRTPVHEDGGRDRGSPLGLHERSDGNISGTWTCWR